MSKYPLEKILKIELETYLDSVQKHVSDYELKGVHVEGRTRDLVTTCFAYEVPESAEVVVDYRITPYRNRQDEAEYGANAYGTALIPREKEDL